MVEQIDVFRLSNVHAVTEKVDGPQRINNFASKVNGGVGKNLNDDDYNYFLAVKNFASTYTWVNVWEEGYGNNKLEIKKKGENFKEITLPDGMWTYKDIEEFLNSELGSVKDEEGKETKGVSIKISTPVLRVVIILKDDTELRFSKEGNFRHLIGFDAKTVSGTEQGSHMPDITHGIDYVYLTCPLVKEETKIGPVSHSIYGFPIANLRLALPFTFQEMNPIWVPMRETKIIKEVRIAFVDAKGVKLNLIPGTNVFLDLFLGRRPKNNRL